jgi:hypothetical protein
MTAAVAFRPGLTLQEVNGSTPHVYEVSGWQKVKPPWPGHRQQTLREKIRNTIWNRRPGTRVAMSRNRASICLPTVCGRSAFRCMITDM